MESDYGIGIRNRYAVFLDDESDPIDFIKKKEEERKLKKKTKSFEKECRVKIEVPNKIKKTQSSKGDSLKPSSQKEIKEERQTVKANDDTQQDWKKRENKQQINGRGDAKRDDENILTNKELISNYEIIKKHNSKNANYRGQKMRNPKRREFDRQSGTNKTGIKSMEKREGNGAYNWGSHKGVIEEAQTQNNLSGWGDEERNEVEPITKPPEMTDITDEIKENEENVETEEPLELTLDEWKAQREAQLANRNRPQYNIRKAGEGEDPNKWKEMYELRRKDEENDFDEGEYDPNKYPQRVGRQRYLLDIEIHFNNERRSGGPSRRRFNRGRVNKDNNQQQQQPRSSSNDEALSQCNEHIPKVDDERDFPSLK
ncbi:plasminogen activator inhibitor 1 RNA-binding protein-like [Agrilus planipennis]|uniref:Plasminogen activator inhibitor 1 RNA-binding protein-like n=1 Tax=Agrilus planipennis TaxID=224129 RepID=A0A7F5R702_AGRPL|nr:plasminogen activator inhibitor 1 RNA-binding protein-like [Agrilus planipennis]